MIRSLFSGVSSVKNHQVRMDTVANNIANVNTYGFKSGRVTFQDNLNQMLRSGGASRNAAQVGTGTTLAAIGNNMGNGPQQMTGRTLDLAINGQGFFKVQQASPDGGGAVADNSSILYTREGAFFLDKEGYIVNANGYYLLDEGDSPQSVGDDLTQIASISVDKNGKITVINNDDSTVEIQLTLAVFNNPEGLEKKGSNLFSKTVASGDDMNSGTLPSEMGSEINSGYLEMSNVDLSEEFTSMITTQRGYQAGSRIITVSDTLLEELINLKR